MSNSAWGAIIGLSFAVGLLVLLSWRRATRPLRLLERMAPYIPPTATTRALADPHPSAGTALVALVKPMLTRPGGSDSVRSRLRRAGREDLDRYRLQQATASATGCALGGSLGILAASGGSPAVAVLLLAGLGAGLGALVTDWLLTQQARKRMARIRQQLPGVAELLAFAVAAGESPVAAIDRLVSTVAGDLSDELALALGDLRAGGSLDQALRGVADRTGSPEVERFVDGLIVSMERGTPLADVLRAQAADARAAERRALMEVAGRKDVAMLVPVVFFILPTVVLIALFPGVQGLQMVVR